jgi:hypothetical protein
VRTNCVEVREGNCFNAVAGGKEHILYVLNRSVEFFTIPISFTPALD